MGDRDDSRRKTGDEESPREGNDGCGGECETHLVEM
jgi:hypothetical protein